MRRKVSQHHVLGRSGEPEWRAQRGPQSHECMSTGSEPRSSELDVSREGRWGSHKLTWAVSGWTLRVHWDGRLSEVLSTHSYGSSSPFKGLKQDRKRMAKAMVSTFIHSLFYSFIPLTLNEYLADGRPHARY